MRMLTMVLSTSEFDFTVEYFPGIRNKLANWGTRNIQSSEWEKTLPLQGELEEVLPPSTH